MGGWIPPIFLLGWIPQERCPREHPHPHPLFQVWRSLGVTGFLGPIRVKLRRPINCIAGFSEDCGKDARRPLSSSVASRSGGRQGEVRRINSGGWNSRLPSLPVTWHSLFGQKEKTMRSRLSSYRVPSVSELGTPSASQETAEGLPISTVRRDSTLEPSQND